MANPADVSQSLYEALCSLVSAHTHQPWEGRLVLVKQTPEELPAGAAVAIKVEQSASNGTIYLLPDDEVSKHTFPDRAQDPDSLLSAWLELVRTSTEELTRALAPYLDGANVTSCQIVPTDPSGAAIARIEVRAADTAVGTVTLLADAALQTLLEQGSPGAKGRKGGPLQPAFATVPPLERVIDVPLAVNLRFGQRSLTLRELLDLNTGSLVELDRQVEEPVDLMLGERVIARGEVVIVDGNYGLRVTEVVDNPVHRLSAVV